MLSCEMINVYLEHLILQIPSLKQEIDDGKLYSFADDCLIMCDSVKEAEHLIEAMGSLQESSLVLKKA